ncbi:hypothetical protein LLS1_24390 [Leifsonia sp. LS1]|uniref:sensor histidine kinase n=1 Tax=Leifsonia sp. LS1 TaxID=2828483 RepID=UPI001CFEA71F|nr:histidine kinase [Leifsonia sp. LS1]GIT80770.1 hypothetical protein LLS1_24390 [Leifsonia sp. LS1]
MATTGAPMMGTRVFRAVTALVAIAAGIMLYAFEESWRTNGVVLLVLAPLAGLVAASAILFVSRGWAQALIVLCAAVSPVAVPALWVALFVRGAQGARRKVIATLCAAWVAGLIQTVLYTTRVDGGFEWGVTVRQIVFLEIGFALVVFVGLGFGELQSRQRRIDHLVASLDDSHRAAASEVRERERIQLGRDLHDTLGANVTVLSLYSRALLADPELDESERIVAVEQLARAGQTLSSDVRATITSLVAGHQAELVPADPENTARTFVAAFAQIGSTFEIDWGDIAAPLPPEVERVLAMFVREALTNALKYSAPGVVRLSVERTVGDGVRATVLSPLPSIVADDVRRRIDSTGVGLRSLRVRAENAGGSLRAAPEGNQYLVRLVLPGRRQDDEAQPADDRSP